MNSQSNEANDEKLSNSNVNDLDDKKQVEKSQNLKNNLDLNSSSSFEIEEEDSKNDFIKKEIQKNKSATIGRHQIHKTQDNQNDTDYSEDDKIEEDESEIDVSEEIKNNDNIIANDLDDNNNYEKKIITETKIKAKDEDKKENQANLATSKSVDEQLSNSVNDESYSVDYSTDKSRFSHCLKQEISRSAEASILESIYLVSSMHFYIPIDIFIGNANEERSTGYTENQEEEDQQSNIPRKKHRRNKYENEDQAKPSYNDENPEEEETIRRHRHRRHRRSKYENEEEEEKSINNDENPEEEETNTRHRRKIHRRNKYENDDNENPTNNAEEEELNSKNPNEEEKIDKSEEEEEKFHFEQENTIDKERNILKNDEKNKEEEKIEDEYINGQNEKKDLFKEEEEKIENKLNDSFDGEKEDNEKAVRSDITKEKDLSEEEKEKIEKKEEDLLNGKEEEEKIEKKQKDFLLEEEEEENETKNEEEEEKVEKKQKDLFEEEEEKKVENKKNDSFEEDEEEKKKKTNDDLGENQGEEEHNETISFIPSEQFSMDLNISPIKKTKKSKDGNIVDSNSDSNKKSSFKQKILQQFSNGGDEEYSDTIEPKQDYTKVDQDSTQKPKIHLISTTSSLVEQTDDKTIGENGEVKEQIKKKKVRRKKVQSFEYKEEEDQIDIQKVSNKKQQKPAINKRGKKKAANFVQQEEDVEEVFDFSDNTNSKVISQIESTKTEQDKLITTPNRVHRTTKRRAKSTQRVSNKQSTTPTEIDIDIPSIKTKKSKTRSQSVRLKQASKKQKKDLNNMSTQTDKFQIDENQVFVFEKIKSKSAYHFNTNNTFLDVESGTQTQTQTESQIDENYRPAINKRRKKNSPIKKRRVPASRSKINDSNEKDDDDQLFQKSISKRKRPRRHLSAQPRRKNIKPIEPSDDDDDDDNIVIDFGDTMYECDQQFSPQAKIEARKKEEKINSRYIISKRKTRTKKSSPIHLLTLASTNDAFPESESSEIFREEKDNDKRPKRTNHQWDIDDLYDNKTTKVQSKPKTKTKTRTKRRSKSVSTLAQKKKNKDSKSIEEIKEKEPKTLENDQNVTHHLPAIKKRAPKKRQQQRINRYDDNDYSDDNNNDIYDNRFSYDEDVKNQRRNKGNDKSKNRLAHTLNHDSNYSIENNRRSLIKRKTKKLSRGKSSEDTVEITDSIVYETEVKSISNLESSDDSNSEFIYEPPKELFDGLMLTFKCTTWDAALNNVYSMDILACNPDE